MVVPVPSGGLLRLTAALPKDDLPQDDKRHLVVEVSDREEVVVLTGNEAEGASPAPSLFLTTAVDPFGGEKGVYRPEASRTGHAQSGGAGLLHRVIASRLPAAHRWSKPARWSPSCAAAAA